LNDPSFVVPQKTNLLSVRADSPFASFSGPSGHSREWAGAGRSIAASCSKQGMPCGLKSAHNSSLCFCARQETGCLKQHLPLPRLLVLS
jgi:hypothetical protein